MPYWEHPEPKPISDLYGTVEHIMLAYAMKEVCAQHGKIVYKFGPAHIGLV
jgi:hypothetical protein